MSLHPVDGSAMPRPNKYLASGPTYTPGESTSPAARTFKLSSNESPVGPSPRALRAIAESAAGQNLYPDPNASSLANAIARHHGLDSGRIVTSPGSDAIINWLVHGWAGEGDEVVYSAHGFQSYRIRTKGRGATPVAAPELALRSSVDSLLQCVTSRTRILFIANPNNPTGTYIGADEMTSLRIRLRSDILLVVDEAYGEYVDAPSYASAIAMVNDTTPNVVVTRTFSKFFGLAGLRVGWAYVPSNFVAPLGLIRGPFAVCRIGIAAAIEALADKDHQNLAKSHNHRWRNWLQAELRAQGFETTDSVGNFALFRVAEGQDAARLLHAKLAAEGYLCRIADQNGLSDWIRVSVGSEEAMRGFMSTMRKVTQS